MAANGYLYDVKMRTLFLRQFGVDPKLTRVVPDRNLPVHSLKISCIVPNSYRTRGVNTGLFLFANNFKFH